MKTKTASLACTIVALAIAASAHAANLCVSFGGAHIVASGATVPVKGTCASFNGFYANKAGFLLAGDICKSSDGTTVRFNTFTQFQGKPDSLVGSWSTSNGSGSGNECTSTGCNAFAVTVTKCPTKVVVPADVPGFEVETSSTFLTEEP
jgi:hypothetical protein